MQGGVNEFQKNL
jgi:hypothetical protein